MDNLVHFSGWAVPADPRLAELRLRISVCGAIDSNGFANSMYQFAHELKLGGFASYSASAACLEVEGSSLAVETFLARFRSECQDGRRVSNMEIAWLDPAGYDVFQVRDDLAVGLDPLLRPDVAICPECAAETLDDHSRYHGYALTSCARCGPRFSVASAGAEGAVANGDSKLCAACREEHQLPGGRRLHASASACPVCGPPVTYSLPDGSIPDGDSLANACTLLKDGAVLAMQSAGGFHLISDATKEDAVDRLRRRQKREERPLAVLFPSLSALLEYCSISACEKEILQSAARPAVILRADGKKLARSVSRHSPYVAAMLPSTGLQHLLLARYGKPLVAVKASKGDEPPALSAEEARERLTGVADAILTDGSRAARSCEDSVVQVADHPMLLRRARGYAPLPVYVSHAVPPLLAVGGHRSNTVAVTRANAVFLSSHVGLLDNLNARVVFHRAIDDLLKLFQIHPEFVACDLNPDYYPSQYAAKCGLPTVRVQHHEAHVAACAVENDVAEPYLGVAWDGGGYGWDGSIWGGEFFWVEGGRMLRCAHFKQFPLLGGEKAVREGWRVAGALMDASGLNCSLLGAAQSKMVAELLAKAAAAPKCSAAGRLFDAVSAIAGIAQENHYDGQAAKMIEWAGGDAAETNGYPFAIEPSTPMTIDWRPLIEAAWKDRLAQAGTGVIASRFHHALGQAVEEVAARMSATRVVLSGGVFQNRLLISCIKRRLEARGRRVFLHQRVPPNDGGLSFGQAVLAAGKMTRG
ncbi:MAG: carbamoyltransferase HypF [Bryobacterales bacterium]|nr:carbamoyltransferase HypF [Bryobacterales bacterium]